MTIWRVWCIMMIVTLRSYYHQGSLSNNDPRWSPLIIIDLHWIITSSPKKRRSILRVAQETWRTQQWHCLVVRILQRCAAYRSVCTKGPKATDPFFFQVENISFTSSFSSKSGIEKVFASTSLTFQKFAWSDKCLSFTHFRWGEERSPSGFGHRCPCATPWNKPVTWRFIAKMIFLFFFFRF